MALLAVKHLDPVVGVDVHSVLVAPSPTPIFLPHPHVGFMLDLREYVEAAKGVVGSIAMAIAQEKATEYLEDHPDVVKKLDDAAQFAAGKLSDIQDNAIVAEALKLEQQAAALQSSVGNALGAGIGMGGAAGRPIFVNGLMRATVGTHSYHVPGLHFPLGESFAPPPAPNPIPSDDAESYMGSRTVLANNDPMSFMALPALSCWAVGMEPPGHNSAHTERTYPSMPSSVMLPIPAGRPVMVGGPPVLNMAAAAKGLFKAFRGSKWAKALADKLHLKPGFLKCNVLHAEPVDVTTGEVIVAQHDFTITGHLPLEWNRCYASRVQRLGTVGVGWSTPADIRLTLISRDDGIGAAIYFVDHATAFDDVPRHEGWAAHAGDWQYGYALYFRDDQLVLRTGEGIEYGFLLPRPWGTIVDGLSGAPQLTLMLDWIGDRYGHAWLFERSTSGQLSRIVEHGIEGPTGRLIECRPNVDVDAHRGLTAGMTLINPDGHAYPLVRYEHDRDRNLVAALDAMSNPRRFDYESGNRMTRHVSASGVSFRYSYRRDADGAWRVDHAWGDDGVLDYRFDYDLARYETRITESTGHVAIIQMNGRHVPIAEIDVLGGMTSYRYDNRWRTCTRTDPMGRTCRWEYDAHGNLIAQFMPDGRSIRAEYDINHKPTCVTGPGGRQFRYEWDARGRLMSRATPSQATFRYAYDNLGRVTACVGPRGDVTSFGYDRYGNLTATVDALGHRTQYERDARGYVIGSLDAAGHQNRYERDPCGRLVRAIEWDGREIHCRYDPDGNLVRYRDPVGNVTRLAYTTLGEIAKRIQPDGTEVLYRYDTEGQLVQVVNERGESYLLKRDALGRIVEEIDYWGQSRVYEYGSTGELLRSIDPHGQAVEYHYDEAGRIVEKRMPDPDRHDGVRTDRFHYDDHGDLIRASNASSLLEFRYDADGRLVEERQGDDFTLFNRYDAAGNRIERRTCVVAGSEIVEQSIRYDYDALSAVVRIEIDGHAPIVIERDALGQIRDERLGDALRREMSYEAKGRLSRQALLADTGEMFAIEYAYDANGDLIERRDSRTGIEQFQYDPVGQVVAHIDSAGTTRRFPYDPAGDLLSTRVFRSSQLRGETGSPAWRREGVHEDSHYVFDRAGNLVHKREANQEITLRWDAAGQLAETLTTRRAGPGDVNDDHHLRVRYEYDAFRRRIRKITSSRRLESGHTSVCQFFWDGDVLSSEVRSDQPDEKNDRTRSVPIRRDVRDWIHYPDTFRPLAVVHRPLGSCIPPAASEHADVEAGSEPSRNRVRTLKAIAGYSSPNTTSATCERPASYRPVGTIYFFHNDPNGAPVRVVDERGRTAWEASYATWSSNTPIQPKDGPSFDQPIRLQGQYYDEETGFSYNRYRYLDHGIGQFISQDPSCIEGGSALYQYAPNPAAWIDPYGLANTIDGHGNTVPIVSLGIPDKSLFKPKSGITTAYSRNSQCGPTAAQTRAVQGKPCAACNQTATTMVADHIDALVVEYYRTGTNDVTVQTSIAAVQPHCPDCSRSQGGKASGFSRAMKKALHIP
ncbi:RHS repeat-associated core domain-containing protein [Burkholderia sp. Ac-20344]|uniref:RHS repeat-associated core domain-containing protein n=1 Tax=Burkholderia sp. Ac-20344 TaxID=2703890 RepID=UPI00197B7223|nr:type IV secretion protein Rhs [Burkholderia sp. Ac-20344]